jgi:hypothetical protein
MKREGEHKSTGTGAPAQPKGAKKTDARLSIGAIAKRLISETGCE